MASQFPFGIVEVDNSQVFESDLPREVFQYAIQILADIVACRPCVAGVKTRKGVMN
jgi:hypothetical protein